LKLTATHYLLYLFTYLFKSQLPQTDPRDVLHYAILLYTKVDVQCDKLATDDRRQFITHNFIQHKCGSKKK